MCGVFLRNEDTMTYTEKNTATEVETRPSTQPIRREAFPDDPDDPYGVRPEIIEEIEEIGRKYAVPQK
jgi:hypothetical protein